MITKWEIIPYPSEKYPDRYKVNIGCDYTDLKKIMDFYSKRCGLPWKSKGAEFSFSFYIYKMTPFGVEEFENKIKELQGMAESSSGAQDTSGKSVSGPDGKKISSSFFQESRQSVSPPRTAKKQATTEEIKVAKELSSIIDFDVFEPEKLEGIEMEKGTPSSTNIETEIKKDLPSEQKTISVGIIFRSGQEELPKIIEDNLIRSVAGKKLKYKIKIVFAKGFLVFSENDINDAIAQCREKNASSVIIAGEPKLAEVLHEALNSAGIFTEHINTTDVNKKSLYFNIATSIILSQTGRKEK